MNLKNTLKVYNTYIHIPFCENKCNYCDFTSFKISGNEDSKYVDYLLKEISLYKKKYDLNVKQDTIYFGGGTPSLLSNNDLKRILSEFNYDETTEITIEINPKTTNKLKLKSYRELGINRLSIGVQSFNNKMLQILGRIHNSREAIRIYKEAKEVGFQNISLDLMFALPKQTLEDLKKDLKELFDLEPEHFSIYSLIWEEGTNFYRDLMAGKLQETDNELEAEMYEFIINEAKEKNYIHYEISNFAKENFESRHNTIYWENKNYLGLGLAAAGYLENKRYKNHTNFLNYYQDLEGDKFPISEEELLNSQEKEQYKYILGFRMLNKKIVADSEYKKKLEELFKEGYVEKIDEAYRITRKGLMLFNDFISNFI